MVSKLSVAMCTYNGAAYLRAQLESVAAQTRLPDELVICDDRSTDETVAVCAAFRARAPFPVHLCVNTLTLGSTRNFEQAIARCTGEIIALCDQDDVWLPEKLQRMEALLVAAPHVGLVFTDAEVVDENLQPQGRRLWQGFKFDPAQQQMFRRGRAFEVLLANNVVTGTTMAFRAAFKDLLLPLPLLTNVIHDGLIALLIAAVADLAFIPAPLVKYRQHAGQQIGPHTPDETLGARVATARQTNARAYVLVAEQLALIYQRLAAYRGAPLRPMAARLLTARIAHLQTRANLPEQRLRRVPWVLKELWGLRYHQHSHGWSSAVKDLLL